MPTNIITPPWGTLFTTLTSANPLPHTTSYTWSVVVRPVERTAKFSKTMLKRLMVEKLTVYSLATALVDITAVNM
jgi:hypothetical protein